MKYKDGELIDDDTANWILKEYIRYADDIFSEMCKNNYCILPSIQWNITGTKFHSSKIKDYNRISVICTVLVPIENFKSSLLSMRRFLIKGITRKYL